MTAAHVVEGAVAVSGQVDGRPHTAWVTRIDQSIDLALLEIGQASSGPILQITNDDPSIGSDVAAFGYPHGRPLRMTEGIALDVGGSEVVKGQSYFGLLETDAVAEPGKSGGPLLNREGRVVGIVIAGDPGPSARHLPCKPQSSGRE